MNVNRRKQEEELMQALGYSNDRYHGPHMQRISDPPSPEWDNENVQLATDFFTYNAIFGTVAANAISVTQNISIQADSKFEWMKATAFGYKDGASEPYQSTDLMPLTCIIQDSGSGRYLMKDPTPIANLFGTGQLPFILPESRIFWPNSTLTVILANPSSSQYDNVTLSFIGRKILRQGVG